MPVDGVLGRLLADADPAGVEHLQEDFGAGVAFGAEGLVVVHSMKARVTPKCGRLQSRSVRHACVREGIDGPQTDAQTRGECLSTRTAADHDGPNDTSGAPVG